MVTLLVGPEKVPILAHRELLAFYSRFFERCLFGSFAESGASKVELPEDNVEDMKCFFTWTYTGCLGTSHVHLDDNSDESPFGLILTQLWILGDRLISPVFSNESMEAMCTWLRYNCLTAAMAEKSYNDTAQGSL